MHYTCYSNFRTESKGLAIFDRDGTLIYDIKGLADPKLAVWLPERLQTLRYLTQMGYMIAIASNQGAIEENLLSEKEVQAVNLEIVLQANKHGIEIWSAIYCPHGKNLGGRFCNCRKPKAGMLIDLFEKSNLPRESKVAFFGDKETDMVAAANSNLAIEGILVNEQNFSSEVKKWAVHA